MMGRKKRRQRTGRSQQPPAARPPEGLTELLAAINEVNPTGRDLPAGERARRYADKSRLQSDLIDRFADDLAVWPDEGDERLVLLACRRTLQTAGHAVVDDLAPAARSWVHRQIDLGLADKPGLEPANDHRSDVPGALSQATGAGARSRSRAEPASVAKDLDAGRAALATYDYATAERHFRAAVAADAGAVQPARALLELLVDHLAAWQDAIAVGESLPAPVRRDAEVAGLTAVAMARSRAMVPQAALLQAATPQRRGAALAALCRRALAADELVEAKRWLAEAAAVAPPPEEVPLLHRRLERARADRRQPLEAALLVAQDSATDGELEAQARALLADFPNSAVAGRVLRQLSERRREQVMRATLARAEAAMAAGDWDRAISRFRAALSGGASEDVVGPRLDAARAAAEQARQGARVAAVVAQVRADEAAGLLAWLALDGSARRAVRAQRDHAAFATLERLDVRPANGEAAVAAALALRDAERDMAAGQAEQAWSRLAPHARLLRRLPQGRGTLAAARRGASAAAQARGLEQLAYIEKLLADGALPEAGAALKRCRAELPDALRELADDLGGRLERRQTTWRLRQRERRAAADGDLLLALDCLQRLLAHGDAADDPKGRLAALDQRIRRQWRVRSFAGDLGRPPGDALDWSVWSGASLQSLLPDGRAVVATRRGQWLFLRRVDVDGQRVEQAAMLRLSGRLKCAAMVVAGDRLLLVATEPTTLLELSLDDWRIERGVPMPPSLQDVVDITSLHVSQDGRTLLISAEQPDMLTETHVLDRASGRHRRALDSGFRLDQVSLAEPGRIFVSSDSDHVRMYDDAGRPISPFIRHGLDQVSGVVASPDGRHVLVLGGCDVPPQREALPPQLDVIRLDANGTERGRFQVNDLHFEQLQWAETAREAALVFLAEFVEEGVEVRALAPETDTLVDAWRIVRSRGTRLLCDADGRQVVAASPGAKGLRLQHLDSTPPRQVRQSPWLERSGLQFEGTFMHCAAVIRRMEGKRMERRIGVVPEFAELQRRAAEATARYATDPLLARAAFSDLASWSRRFDTSAAMAQMRTALADDVGIRVEDALRQASSGNWRQVRALLEEPIDGIDAEEAEQLTALHCVAHLQCGDLSAAAAALPHHGEPLPRQLAVLRDYVEACVPAAGPVEADGDQHAWVALARAVVRARELLHEERPAEALGVLAQPELRALKELQSRAARAEARLALPASDAVGLLAEAELLADFLASVAERERPLPLGTDLPIPGVSLGAEAIAALAERAAARLDAIARGGSSGVEPALGRSVAKR